jgi:hypothetical protein
MFAYRADRQVRACVHHVRAYRIRQTRMRLLNDKTGARGRRGKERPRTRRGVESGHGSWAGIPHPDRCGPARRTARRQRLLTGYIGLRDETQILLLGKVHFLRATFGKSCRSPDTENPADAGFMIGDYRPEGVVKSPD